MIHLIGFQRFIIICILAGIAILFAAVNFNYLRPQANALSSELSGYSNEETMLRGEIDDMRTGMEQFKRQQIYFKKIEADGFFNLQDRVAAREILNTMQRDTKIVTLKYEIKSAYMTLPEGVTDDKYALLTSPLSMEINAMDDIDIYKFLGLLLYQFPGIVNITDMEIKAGEALTTDVLKNIGSGEAKVLVTATLTADWITVAPRGTAPWSSDTDPNIINGGGVQ